MHKQYTKIYILFFFIFSSPIFLSSIFLLNTGELQSINKIVRRQLDSPDILIAGLVTRNLGYQYKHALYEAVKPEILIMGSSRVLQFRSQFFTSPMITAGGSMSSLSQGLSFLDTALSIHKPKLIILGIDYWWFDENSVNPNFKYNGNLDKGDRITLKGFLLPYKWILEKKISIAEYFEILRNWNLKRSGIGVNSVLKKTGFSKDGSYFYTKKVIGRENDTSEISFSQSRSFLKKADQSFKKTSLINQKHLSSFLKMVATIQDLGIPLIIFIPPIAPELEKMLDEFTNLSKYIDELKISLKSVDSKIYDFHNTKKVYSSNCEFIDGIHGGDVLYARMLDYMAKNSPDLKNYINEKYIDFVHTKFRDMSMIPNPQITTDPEADFLKIGCSKKPHDFNVY